MSAAAIISSSFRNRARDHVTLGVYDLCEFRAGSVRAARLVQCVDLMVQTLQSRMASDSAGRRDISAEIVVFPATLACSLVQNADSVGAMVDCLIRVSEVPSNIGKSRSVPEVL